MKWSIFYEKSNQNSGAPSACGNYHRKLRLVPVRLHGRRIDFYTASLEDIVIAKLYSGRATDIQDIIDPRVLKEINWDRLEYLATADDEAKASALNEFRYAEFLDSYRTYIRRWRDCENSLSEGFSLSM